MKRTFNARSDKRMSYKTPVLHTLLDVRKTCVNKRTLNMRLLDQCVYQKKKKNKNQTKTERYTHVTHFPV